MAGSDWELRKKLAEACRILDREGLGEHFGHVSARASDRKSILLSPRLPMGLVKGPADILRVSMGGTVYKVPARGGKSAPALPKLSPPRELFAHTEIYRIRPDVNAICRIQGPFALALSALRRPVRPLWSAAAALGREIPVFDSAEPVGTPAAGHRMARLLGAGRALLLRGNGQIAVGASVEEAVVNAIVLEAAAAAQWRAECLGDPLWIEGEEYARQAKPDAADLELLWNYYHSRSKSR
ncbi:MAG TPA: class II aldolase/adducin family protein [Terriglobia bacterium]|nr:class II aldolase/adducin family protein [Terriglobia bacterium]